MEGRERRVCVWFVSMSALGRGRNGVNVTVAQRSSSRRMDAKEVQRLQHGWYAK